ncbi:hypothetical protein FH972_012650 [Carpinus fangiana]|uniref:Uncharacterized protein n=1 Tax=Carpinus fangiana TaxID=176857 RepID=A0A5N6R4F8_9ROSI|nr:hypothetical protein FH972_012650 [Carpinus fangiana]
MYYVTKMRLDCKPPLAKLPVRLHPCRVLRLNSTSLQTPPGSLTKFKRPNCWFGTNSSDLQPEYLSISCELCALSKMVHNEFGNGDLDNTGIFDSFSANSSTLFERGRFYKEYSGRRNERLKRKKSEPRDGRKSMYYLGVTVEFVKKSTSMKKLESLRKSVSVAYTVERSEAPTPRYMLRSIRKENKKPPRSGYHF